MDKMFFGQRKAAAVVLVLVIAVQQISASPVVPVQSSVQASVQSSVQTSDQSSVQAQQSPLTLRRRARRMSPMWRVLNSKPFGAYCQNNYECSTGFCSGGFCATAIAPVKN